jgi:hypothetical protein
MRLGTRREKVFGPGRAVPLDRNAKARIMAYSRAWDRLHRVPGQRGGALGRAALDVLGALLWVFHNARTGVCFPSYERIAEQAGCARSTVAEAIKALEWAGADLAEPDHPHPRALPGPLGPRWLALAGHPDQQRLRAARSGFQVRPTDWNTRSRKFKASTGTSR